MPLADPASPIPARLGATRQTFICPAKSSFLGSLFGSPKPAEWTVTVCENGVASRDSRQLPPRVLQNLDIAWDEFVAWQSMLTHTIRGFTSSDFNLYVFEAADGKNFSFGNNVGLQGTEQLGGLIQAELFRRLLPRLTAAFNSGETVDCGEIRLSQQGLSWENEHIPWNAVTRVTVDSGEFLLDRAGQPQKKVHVCEIKNFDIFWTILQSVLKAKGAG